ncbi:MAG: aminoglycoside phosphotransferase family protein [Anaerolineae bacterium]|jgi:thiamine kinase-like enzyme
MKTPTDTKHILGEAPDWLGLVAAAHENGAYTWTQGSVTVHRVPGGGNNALYRVEVDGTQYACKLCVADKRHRAAQEYASLRLLHVAGLDVAPQPLCLDASGTVVPLATVVYRWLPGVSLNPPLTADQLTAFLHSLQRIHTLRPGDFESELADSWFHWFDFGLYLTEMGDFIESFGPWLATTEPDGQDLHDRMARLLDHCAQVVANSEANAAREHVALRLCRVDANLANTVWDAGPPLSSPPGRGPRGGKVRWVDWEYCGWGDPALDLAGPRWHAALEGLSAAQQRWLRDNYRRPTDDPAFEARLAVWDHIISTRWTFLVLRYLWSQYHGPDRVRLTQLPADPAELRARLVRFIERAERFAGVG